MLAITERIEILRLNNVEPAVLNLNLLNDRYVTTELKYRETDENTGQQLYIMAKKVQKVIVDSIIKAVQSAETGGWNWWCR